MTYFLTRCIPYTLWSLTSAYANWHFAKKLWQTSLSYLDHLASQEGDDPPVRRSKYVKIVLLVILILITIALAYLYTYDTYWTVGNGLVFNINNYLTGFMFGLNALSYIPVCISLYNFTRALKKNNSQDANKCLFSTFFIMLLLNFSAFFMIFVSQSIFYQMSNESISTKGLQ